MDADARYADVIEKYNRYINPGFARLVSFAGFGVEVRGEGCYIYDHAGRKFLDCLGGYGTFALGHRHPDVIAAVKDQLDRLALSGKAFFNEEAANLAEMLAEIAPGDLQYSFFCNSGAEACEAALKFAKGATGRPGIVSTIGSYHGKTLGVLSVTGREKYRKKFEPLLPGVSFVPYGDAEAAEKAINDQTAAFIVEPIQGEGGIHIPPDGYLRRVRAACDKHGALLIMDEVQTCLGRTGKMFACEHEGVNPDLMTLAKQVGGGVMPLGVLMGTPAVWEKVYGDNPLIHTSTFGGNSLACCAGLAGIKVLKREGLVERSAKMGEYMKRKFEGVQAKYSDMLAYVRGRGLMIGIEFAEDEVGELVVAQLMKRGVSVAYALNNPRVLRFEPPLIITEAEIDFCTTALEEALAETKALLSDLVEV
ncbi:MAG: aspartate aminotransferase family protein [Armatimonadetes bacterium]|nr:aspartate aminotransferase family protein [Armatimonadota bacterium]